MELECKVYVKLDGEKVVRVAVPLSEERLKEYLGQLWLVDEIRRRFNNPTPDQVAALLAIIETKIGPAHMQKSYHLTISEESDESTDDQGQDAETVVMLAFRLLGELLV
jgi:hypothetical protein